MKIAVISDTHNYWRGPLPGALAAADEIWHLGDICRPEILFSLAHLKVPVFNVRGNCDARMDWPLTLYLERMGLRFYLIHIPPRRAPENCDVLLHGHTHIPRDEVISNVRYLNPGCVSNPKWGVPTSFAWLELDKDKTMRWELVLLDS